jgi:MFS family permease
MFSDRYKGYVLSLLLLAYTFNFIDRTILATIGIKVREDLGLSNAQMGILGGLYFALTYTILGIPIARLAERYNRARIISLALLVWSGFTALCGTASSFGTLAMYRFGVGIGEAGCSPPSHSLISDYYEPNRRASALSIYSFGIPLGTMFGAAIGGFLAQWFGWRVAFMVVGLPGVILALVTWLTVKEPPRGHSEMREAPPALAEGATPEPIHPKPGLWSELKEIGAVTKTLFAQWPVLNMALGVTIASFGSYGSGAFVQQYIYTTFPLSLGLTGLLVGLIMSGFSAGVGTLVGGFLSDRLSKRSPVWYSLTPAIGLLIALPLYLFAFTRSDWKLMFAVLLVPGIFHYTYLAPTFAVAQNAVPAYRRATATAILFFFLNFIALGGGPTFTGSLVDYYAAYGFTHPGDHTLWAPLGGALAHATGETLMSYVHIVTGLVDMATGAKAVLLPTPTTGFAHACPGGRAPAAAGAAAAIACKSALSWGSQQGVLISLCFYAWAAIHYFLGTIGLAKAIARKPEVAA